jgi:hypothetical protein
MEEHGGELSLADAANLPGARVTLRLPLAAVATQHTVTDATTEPSYAATPPAAAPALKDA